MKNVSKIVVISLVLNILLTLIKITFGFIGNANSLIADGFNSLSDIFVSVIILVVLKISTKKADKNHHYGHEKIEGVSYMLLSYIIVFTAIILLYNSGKSLYNFIYNNGVILKPESYTLIVGIVALLIKLFLFIINRIGYNKTKVKSLYADSKNHLFDTLATSVSIISIILARFDFLVFEPIASIIIALFILKTGVEMIIDATSYLVDEAPKKATMNKIRETILNVEGVIKIDMLKARKHMNDIYVDVDIAVNQYLSLLKAHEIAENVHKKVVEDFSVIYCMVHVNPYKEGVKNEEAIISS